MSLFPAVVPVSAMHAFVYRCGSRLSFDEFKEMDDDFIENIGKDYYGRQWNRFGESKKKEKAYQAVSEKEYRQEGIEASNFEAFAKVLSYCIGDVANQKVLIEKQTEVALKRLKHAPPGCDLGEELVSAHSKLAVLGKPVDHLSGVFWAAFKKLRDAAYEEFKSDLSPKAFGAPMKQLHNYLRALSLLQWPGELEKVSENAKEVALQYATLLTESSGFQQMSENDQALILGSMLLYSSNDCFALNFGFLKIYLETKRLAILSHKGQGQCYSKTCQGTLEENASSYGKGTEHCNSCQKVWIERITNKCPRCSSSYSYPLSHTRDGSGEDSAVCSHCSWTFHIQKTSLCNLTFGVNNGKLVPTDMELYKKSVTVEVPESIF